MYNDEIIQIIGGLNDYAGELDQTEHPNGPGWYRIKEPCLVYVEANPQTGKLTNRIRRFVGPPGDPDYRNYVDVYIPDCVQMEIRVLVKDGRMYKVYKEEINRKKSSLYLPDDNSIIKQ